MQRLICFPILIYRYFFSFFFPPRCRFSPSCSQYALLAINKFGICKGLRYTVLRLLRCHPFAKGGYDPLPKDEKL